MWRLLVDDGASAGEGLALDEALMRSREPASDPVLRLYTYKSHAALVGRFQDTAAELDLDSCERLGVGVNRRLTGGGAIVMGSDQLGVAFATHLSRPETPQHARAMVLGFGQAVALGLERLGITCEVRGKNDIAVDGRKIAGLGVHIDERNSVLFHASILVDLDIDLMLEVLNIPAAKLGGKATSAVRDRITTVREQSGRSLEDLRAAVAAGFEEAFEIGFAASEVSQTELAEADLLAKERYADPSWVMLRSTGDVPEGAALLKTPGGLLRIYVALDGEAIKNVMLTGDFMATDRALAEIDTRLRWVPPDRERVASAVTEGTSIGGGLTGVPENDLVEAIWQAVLDARAKRGMTTGSCYYPPITAGRNV